MVSPRIKPVYNVGDYGQDKFLGISDQLTGQTFTYSGLTSIQRTTENANFPIEAYEETYSNVDTGIILHEGDNTAFDRIYQWAPDMTAVVYKVAINIAFALNVSAYTSGNFAIDLVRFRISQPSTPQAIADLSFASTLANLAAVGNQMFIVSAEYASKFRVYQGLPITIQVDVTETTGVGTRQIGIVPVFPMQTVNAPKILYRSGFDMHVHADVTHADPVFNFEPERIEQ